MDWINLITTIFGGGGIITVGIMLYKASTEKESLAIKNLREVIEEIKSNSSEYKKENDEKITRLEETVLEMKRENEIKDRAIARGIRCEFPPAQKSCPVLMFMDEENKEKKTDA